MGIKVITTDTLGTNNDILVDLLQIQFSTMPTASADYVGKVVQYIGTTNSTYTNGYFYKCVEGSTSGTYEWQATSVQAGGSGSSVQSDWNQTSTSAADYIKNKPTSFPDDQIGGTATDTLITLTDSADGYLQRVMVKGQSQVVSVGDSESDVVYFTIRSIGENGFTITTANSDYTTQSSATITTGLPLRSVSDSVYDTMDNEKVEKKCGIIDLGDINWSYQGGQFINENFDANGGRDLICAEYNLVKYSTWASMSDGDIMIHPSNNSKIHIQDSRYTDATTFKAAVTGKKLIYELAIPITNSLTVSEWSALATLRTFDSTTHINASMYPLMTVDYLKNTDNGKTIAKIQNNSSVSNATIDIRSTDPANPTAGQMWVLVSS